MAAQLGLKLQDGPSHARSAFQVSRSNAAAVEALDAWPDWRGGALALVGPPGCGKSHLAAIWAERTGAQAWPCAGPRERALLVDDAETGLLAQAGGEEALFHLLNAAAQPGCALLLTAARPPSRWPVALPDLRSRLNALPLTAIEEPDDPVLAAMLRKFFRERSIRPSDDLLAYLVRRIERSGARAAQVVAQLDAAAHAGGRAVTRSLARTLLEGEAADLEPLGEA